MDSKISVVLLLLLSCSLQRVYSQESSSTTLAPTPESSSTTLAPTPESSSTTLAPTPESSSTTLAPTSEISSSESSTSESSTTPAPIFSCSLYGGMPVELKNISGVWYEFARAPDKESTQCTKVSMSDSPNADNILSVQLEYVETAGDKWDHEKKSVLLPWDDEAKKGIFTWQTGGTTKQTATLKLLEIFDESHALFCGYVGTETEPQFKLLTRRREFTAEEKAQVQKDFKDAYNGMELIWVEQNEQKCNSAMRSAGGALVALALALLIRQRNY